MMRIRQISPDEFLNLCNRYGPANTSCALIEKLKSYGLIADVPQQIYVPEPIRKWKWALRHEGSTHIFISSEYYKDAAEIQADKTIDKDIIVIQKLEKVFQEVVE